MVDLEKDEAIIKIPAARNVTDVRRIIASWYRRFVPNFSSIIATMTRLLHKNAKFIWDDTCQSALDQIKEHLVFAPILSCPNHELPFTIQTDA